MGRVRAFCDVPDIDVNPRIRRVWLKLQTSELVQLYIDLAVGRTPFQLRVMDVPLCDLLEVVMDTGVVRVVESESGDELWQFRLIDRLFDDPLGGCSLIHPHGSQFTVCRGDEALVLDGALELSIIRQRSPAGLEQVELSIGREGAVIALRILTIRLLASLTEAELLELVDVNDLVCTVRNPFAAQAQSPEALSA